ncbi:uncharacterized protein LOC133202238 [Saccostrea echinata]|uniref:uncharacterized protein LOC133202238 n=1 Tax=Saccostrea echinata TaxID=191078 RepID=UPI002A818212|nr:uncharacterized protein LOC133202238 [Saccostrea echinata]
MTMVAYNWTIDEGNPVFLRNGTFMKKTSDAEHGVAHLCEEKPVTSEEMEEVITADGNYRFMFAINNQFPGPTISAYENQRVKIHVYNDLANEAVTFHWHGMSQNGSVYMDGVSMVTQCPILPGQMFTYLFTANPQGTHWYHAHHGVMRSMGLAGAFIVLPRKGNERNDVPKADDDFVFMVQDWTYPESDLQLVKFQEWYMLPFVKNMDSDECLQTKLTYDGSLSSLTMPYNNALVNGKTKYFSDDSSEQQRAIPLEIFNVASNSYTRFRVINSGMTGEYKISIDKHKLLLTDTDGGDLAPIYIDFLLISPGESYDVILYANNTPGNYWIRVETTEVMDYNHNPVKPNVSFAQLHYNEAEDDLPDTEERECSEREPCVMTNCHWSLITMAKREPYTKCLSVVDLRASSQHSNTNPVDVPTSRDNFQEIFLNFNFRGTDSMRRRPAVNTIHYKSPPMPLQVFPDIVEDRNIVCNNDHMNNCGVYCRCTHVVKLDAWKTAQLVLTAEVNVTRGSAHPIHLHGNRFHVLKYGLPVINKTTGLIEKENQDIEYFNNYSKARWRNSSWEYGNIPDINIVDPPHKDTVVVPFRGYVVVRLQTNNPGFWFMHCHLDDHMSLGMDVVIQVGEPHEMPKPPPHFPKCWNFKAEFNSKSSSKSQSEKKSLSDREDDNFLQLPAVSDITTKGHEEHEDESYDTHIFSINYTSYVVMVVFMMVFLFGFLLLSLVLVIKQCNWTGSSSRRRGYTEIGSEQRVKYSK